MAIVLLGLSGLLIGGAISMWRQGASKVVVVVLALLAVLAGAGGVFWLLPES